MMSQCHKLVESLRLWTSTVLSDISINQNGILTIETLIKGDEMRVVPELYCFDIELTKRFFIDVLGFSVKYERREEQFVYLTLDGVDLMIEGLDSPSRKWLTGPLEAPLGRGMNLQWDVDNIEHLYNSVIANSPDNVYLPLETTGYQCGDNVVSQQQFIIQTPDGYLFRFCQDCE